MIHGWCSFFFISFGNYVYRLYHRTQVHARARARMHAHTLWLAFCTPHRPRCLRRRRRCRDRFLTHTRRSHLSTAGWRRRRITGCPWGPRRARARKKKAIARQMTFQRLSQSGLRDTQINLFCGAGRELRAGRGWGQPGGGGRVRSCCRGRICACFVYTEVSFALLRSFCSPLAFVRSCSVVRAA